MDSVMKNVGARPGTFIEIGGRYYRVTEVHRMNVKLRELDPIKTEQVRAALEAVKVRL